MQLLKSRDFLFYLMKGLELLPPVSETVYRGVPGAHLAIVRSKYLLDGDVHWSAFNSTTTNIDKAKRFAEGPVCYCNALWYSLELQLTLLLQGGVIFRIKILNGRRVTA
jgi:hypothetical protein